MLSLNSIEHQASADLHWACFGRVSRIMRGRRAFMWNSPMPSPHFPKGQSWLSQATHSQWADVWAIFPPSSAFSVGASFFLKTSRSTCLLLFLSQIWFKVALAQAPAPAFHSCTTTAGARLHTRLLWLCHAPICPWVCVGSKKQTILFQ